MRALCIAVHDVAPATWLPCEALLALLRDVGAPPATLLVVPDYHRRGCVECDRAFVRAIDRRLARGDEVALHGYHHVDDGPVPHSPTEWLQRRWLTASEGEFSALTQHEAEQRIDAGLAMFARLQWHASGFVAPAWLLGDGARAALARTTIRYTSTHAHLESLAEGRRIPAPAISASARSEWRRWMSRRWLAIARTALRNEPLLRVALHPADAADAGLLAAWRTLLRALLADRVALTKSDALAKSLAAEPALARA
ncbi:MAG TPA: polysaccharide deacetylase family protein [Rhodanobacteraceae bacterium]|nr:polysaccharide deacetylase family protein [Rhodanobacteraceae bacterium]